MKRAIVLILLFLVLLRGTAHAEQASYSINPPIHLIQVHPDQLVKKEITVKNNAHSPLTLEMNVISIEPSNDRKGGIRPAEPSNADAAFLSAVKLMLDGIEIERFTLEPLAEKTITIEARVPNGSRYHDYYFAVTFSTLADEADVTDSNSNILPSIGSTFILHQPSSHTSPRIELDVPSYFSSGPIEYRILARNNTDKAQIYNGKVKIYNILNKQVDEINLTPVILLRGDERYLTPNTHSLSQESPLRWNKDVLAGSYKLTVFDQNNAESPLVSAQTFIIPLGSLLIMSAIAIFTLGISLRVIRKIRV